MRNDTLLFSLLVLLFVLSAVCPASLITAAASDLFQDEGLGAINGAVGAAFGAGAAFFPWVAGWAFDTTGSYDVALLLATGAVFVSAAALWWAVGIRAKEKR